ncbi:MAG: hypothetical protein JWM93_1731 [Frankiales bacterium]|nr:hypothetical protein [Frankiales bacterium]
MTRVTLAMRCALPMRGPAVELPPGYDLRPLAPGDVGALGQLMYDAYRGGVEDHGESLEYHHDEAAKAFRGGYGDVLWDASFWVTTAGTPVAATVVTDWSDVGETAGLSFVLVDPAHRGRGVAAALIQSSGAVLAAANHARWVLAVVPENPARRLYERLGFEEFVPDVRKG